MREGGEGAGKSRGWLRVQSRGCRCNPTLDKTRTYTTHGHKIHVRARARTHARPHTHAHHFAARVHGNRRARRRHLCGRVKRTSSSADERTAHAQATCLMIAVVRRLGRRQHRQQRQQRRVPRHPLKSAGSEFVALHLVRESNLPPHSSSRESEQSLWIRAPLSLGMPPKRDAGDGGGGGGAAKKSRLSQKTAAEFFAENKQFAGESTPAGCASAAPVRVSHRRRARTPAHPLTRSPARRAPRAPGTPSRVSSQGLIIRASRSTRPSASWWKTASTRPRP